MFNSTGFQNKPIKRIAILGGGMTGWTVAAALANGLRGMDIEIALIDSPTQTELDLHSEASTPACVAFHQLLGISEQDLVMKTGASFLLATEFNGWADQQQQYFMPFNGHGFMLNRIEFSHYATSHYLGGKPLNYDDYSLSAIAAKMGRFCHPSMQEASLFSTLSYGLTLNTQAYAEYLSRLALDLGVTRINAEANTVKLEVDGNIDSISLVNILPGNCKDWVNSDSALSADLFIDCSGITAQLIEKTLQVEWLPLTNQLPATPAATSRSPVTHVLSHAQPLPIGGAISGARELRTAAAGWVQKNTTQTHVEQQYFYHGDFVSREQACAGLGVDAAAAMVSQLRTGRRKNFWHNNCVSIGNSAANPDQLAAGKLHLVQSAVLRLLNLFPSHINATFNRAEYNRLTHLELDHIEDFHALHYQLAKTQATEYWQKISRIQLSDRLLHKLELFKRRGVIAFYEGETFPSCVWISLLLGNGFWPQRFDPLVQTMGSLWIVQQLDKMKKMMRSAADAMPTQAMYLNKQKMAVVTDFKVAVNSN